MSENNFERVSAPRLRRDIETWIRYFRILIAFFFCLLFALFMTYLGAGLALLAQEHVGEFMALLIFVTFFVGGFGMVVIWGDQLLRQVAAWELRPHSLAFRLLDNLVQRT